MMIWEKRKVVGCPKRIVGLVEDPCFKEFVFKSVDQL